MLPNVITYTALISACEKGNGLTSAMDVFRAMQEQHVHPDVITYNALISACDTFLDDLEAPSQS